MLLAADIGFAGLALRVEGVELLFEPAWSPIARPCRRWLSPPIAGAPRSACAASVPGTPASRPPWPHALGIASLGRLRGDMRPGIDPFPSADAGILGNHFRQVPRHGTGDWTGRQQQDVEQPVRVRRLPREGIGERRNLQQGPMRRWRRNAESRQAVPRQAVVEQVRLLAEHEGHVPPVLLALGGQPRGNGFAGADFGVRRQQHDRPVARRFGVGGARSQQRQVAGDTGRRRERHLVTTERTEIGGFGHGGSLSVRASYGER